MYIYVYIYMSLSLKLIYILGLRRLTTSFFSSLKTAINRVLQPLKNWFGGGGRSCLPNRDTPSTQALPPFLP